MEDKKAKTMKSLVKNSNFYIKERFGDIVGDLIDVGLLKGGSHASKHTIVDHFNCDYNNSEELKNFLKRTFWVFSDIISPEDLCGDCSDGKNYRGSKIDLMFLDEIPEVFYDWSPKIKFGCVKISVNNNFAGFYCPKYQMFYLSDWTHNRGCLNVAKFLLPILFEKAMAFGFTIEKPSNIETIIKFPKWKVIIGSDPEFEELEYNNIYSPIPTTIDGGEHSEIGRDGAGDQIEIRPKPGTLKEVISNIRELILRIPVPISVKGDRFPLGCHIHFSIPEELINSYHVATICQLLDDFLGERLIELSGRARGSYKKLTAFELKNWGFEYRTLPSAVLLNPTIARITFKIAKNIVEKFIRHGKITYNEQPTIEDYVKHAKLTPKEYEIFDNFCKNYKSMYSGEAINVNWRFKKLQKKIRIIYYDDWLEENKLAIATIIKRSRILKKLGVEEIVLYGLKKERGRVISGFNCRGYETIPHPIGQSHKFIFGLPWEVRMTEEGITELKKLGKAIIKHIQQNYRKGGVKDVRYMC